MDMVGRPVNIQGTRDWIMFFREHVMGQPYLTLCRQGRDARDRAPPDLQHPLRRCGPGGAAGAAIVTCAPDVVVLQEATRPDVVERLAATTGMRTWAATEGHSVGFMSRLEIAHHQWHRPAGAAARTWRSCPPATPCASSAST